MTSPPRPVTIRCPRCSTVFETYHHASWNRDLDPISDEELEEMYRRTCPRCGLVMELDDAIIVRGDTWTMGR